MDKVFFVRNVPEAVDNDALQRAVENAYGVKIASVEISGSNASLCTFVRSSESDLVKKNSFPPMIGSSVEVLKQMPPIEEISFAELEMK